MIIIIPTTMIRGIKIGIKPMSLPITQTIRPKANVTNPIFIVSFFIVFTKSSLSWHKMLVKRKIYAKRRR